MIHRTLSSIALVGATLLLGLVTAASAAEKPEPFYFLGAEVDGADSDAGTLYTWDVEGWVGDDVHKAKFIAEGERDDGSMEQNEFWFLYSRNVSEFWDLRAGIRHDAEPSNLTWGTIGFEGLAPLFIESEVSLLFSEEGDVGARLEHEIDLRITQKLVAQPHVELNLYGQNKEQHEIGRGLSHGEFGLQVRYEIVRKFAPYVDFVYEHAFGEAGDFRREEDESRSEFTVRGGVSVWF